MEDAAQALLAPVRGEVWERVFDDLTKDRDNHYLMLDSTLVRPHQQAATGKGEPKIRLWGVPRWTDHQNPHARR